jgi:hypothetical protein
MSKYLHFNLPSNTDLLIMLAVVSVLLLLEASHYMGVW